MLSTKIKNIRELKNLTQEHMAERLKISQTAYSKLESGKTKITPEKLLVISEILEIDPDAILGFDTKKYLSGELQESMNLSNLTVKVEISFLRNLYLAKIDLLKKLLEKTEKELEYYKSRYGEIY